MGGHQSSSRGGTCLRIEAAELPDSSKVFGLDTLNSLALNQDFSVSVPLMWGLGWLLRGTVLYVTGYLPQSGLRPSEASSTQFSRCDYKDVYRYCQMSPGGKLTQVENCCPQWIRQIITAFSTQKGKVKGWQIHLSREIILTAIRWNHGRAGRGRGNFTFKKSLTLYYMYLRKEQVGWGSQSKHRLGRQTLYRVN